MYIYIVSVYYRNNFMVFVNILFNINISRQLSAILSFDTYTHIYIYIYIYYIYIYINVI